MHHDRNRNTPTKQQWWRADVRVATQDRARLRDLEGAALRLLEQHFVQVVFSDGASSLISEEEALVNYFLQHGVDTGPEQIPFYRYVFQRLNDHYQELAEDWESPNNGECRANIKAENPLLGLWAECRAEDDVAERINQRSEAKRR